MGAELVATISGVASAIAVIVVSLRKRRDVDVEEMERRITSLSDRVESAEGKIADLRSQLVIAEGHIFILRRTLAAHGVPDPLGDLDTGDAAP